MTDTIMWRIDYDFLKANTGATLPTDDYNSWSRPFIERFAKQYDCTYDVSRHLLSCSEEAFTFIKLACPDAISSVFLPYGARSQHVSVLANKP